MTDPLVLGSGRFTVQRRIGAGGMGVVYEAWDREREEVVALKKLIGRDGAAIVRLKNEFRALADVVHPNLVRLYELIGEGDDWFFTMELVDGVDFLNFVRRRSPSPLDDATTEKSTLIDSGRGFPPAGESEPAPVPGEPVERVPVDFDLVRRTMRQIAEGVAALHDVGKLHRDLKPSNVLVTPDERVVILDFGLATDVTGLQRKTTFGGTPAYMAPEQIAELPPTSASDCYSIGVMLYEALTSTLPFSGNFYSMLMQKRTTDPRPPSDVVPGVPEDLSRLCAELLRRNPEDRLPARAMAERLAPKERILPTIYRPRETPFVGRVLELARLGDALKSIDRGAPVTVMLRGPSGIGKSALVRQFLLSVQQRDPSTVIFTGRCYEQESVPYKAVDSLIDDLARYLKQVTALEAKALLPRDAAALGRLFPVLQELDPIARAQHRKPMDIVDSLELRRRAFAALRELFSRLADEHRVILFLDDVQWGDRDSVALLAEVLRPPDAPPVLVIASYRSEEAAASPWLSELQKYRNEMGEIREIGLGELTASEARDLALSLLGEPAEVADRADAIAREAGGSPFFIAELARYSESTGLATNDLDDVIRSRIALLPDVARELLEIVAVAGQPISAAAANAAANLHASDAAMQARLRADHLLRTRVRAGREELDTYHDRIREAILASLDEERSRVHHATLAKTLEAQGRRDPELLAVHYRGAGDRAKAAAYALEAGDRAAAALAFENAAHLFQMALELEGRARPELLAKLADALANAGRGADAASYYMRAAEGSGPADALELRRRASENLLRAGHVDAGLHIIRTVLASVGMKLPETRRRAMLGIMAGRALLLARGYRFKERPAAEVPRELLTKIDVGWAVTTGLSRIDNMRALYFQPIHLRDALQAGEPYRVARALAVEAAFSATRGEKSRRRTEKLVTRTERVARRAGEPHAIGVSMLARSLESFYLGLFRDAFQKAEEAETIFRERCTGVAWEINTSVNYALCSLAFLGEVAQLAQRIPPRLREAEEHGDLYAGMDPVCRPGILWLAADDPEGGRRAVRQVMDRWSLEGFHFQHYLEMVAENQIDLYLGNWASAWRRADERWPQVKASLMLRIPFVKMEGLHLKGRSALAAAIGSRDRALIDSAERDAAGIESEKAPWARPWALSLRAGVAKLRGREQQAAELLDRAARGFERGEMNLFARAAAYRRGQLIGGDEGRALREAAESWMTAQGVKNVPRLVDVLVPGFA